MLTRIRIRPDERGLVLRSGRFEQVLGPGVHWRWQLTGPRHREQVEVIDQLQTRLEHPQLERLLACSQLRDALHIANIADHQRALVWVDGRLTHFLRQGRYAFWKEPRTVQIEVVDTLITRLEHENLDVLLADQNIRRELRVLDLRDEERALIWVDGRLAHILGTGRHAFWTTPRTVEFEVFQVGAFRLSHPRWASIVEHPDAKRFLDVVTVPPYARAPLFRAGELVETLGPGVHALWKQADLVGCVTIDLREQIAEVAGQEIMTSDKVTLRVNLLVTYQVADAAKAVNTVSDYKDAVYREAQLALRATIGTRSLDSLLGEKEAIGRNVADMLQPRTAEFGVTIRSVGLRDIILPGEMKAILNQVITAEKQAQANLIRRREETAAARSQANTARIMAENPHLARMKELEMLQEIVAGSKAVFVLGRGDAVAQVRGLVGGDDVSN
jgi:regulator of protease activity HflC (stomatin/prohibitin superfamily)